MKKRILCPDLPKKGIPTLLSETEAHHAIRVLRMRDGEIVGAMDGKGHQGIATLRIRGGHPRLEFIESENTNVPLRHIENLPVLTLEMAVLKGDAMEWVVEKSVELGIQELIPVLTDFTVVQMKSKGPESFRDRWQKIADQALKQCGRPEQMKIHLPVSLEDLLTQAVQPTSSAPRLWCDESSGTNSPFLLDWLNSNSSSSGLRVLIGPEGGWSSKERLLLQGEVEGPPKRTATFRIDLGPRILRAETAAIFTLSVASAYLGKRQ